MHGQAAHSPGTEEDQRLLGHSAHLRAEAVAVGLVVVHQVFSVVCIDPSGLQEKLLGNTDGHEVLPSNLQNADTVAANDGSTGMPENGPKQ